MFDAVFIKIYKRTQPNRWLVVTTLYIFRIYHITRRNFYKSYYKRNSQVIQAQAWLSDNSDCQNKWDWTDLPRLWPILTYYERFSSGYYAWAVIKNWIPDRLIQLIDLFKPPMKSHCYLLGHFVIHDAVSRYVVIMMGISHLTYRIVQFLANRAYSLTMLTFLIITEHDLSQFIDLLHRHNQRQLNGPLVDKSDSATSLKLTGTESLSIDLEQLFKDTLCFKVEYGHKILYRVRPNRTLEAQRLLHRRVGQTVFYTICLLAALMAVIMPALIPLMLSNKRYLLYYPNCSPYFDLLQRENKLNEWSFPWGRHQTLTILVDAIESLMLWLDSLLACIIAWPVVYLLNYDNLLYWQKLDSRLKQLCAEVRVDYESSRSVVVEGSQPPSGESQSSPDWPKQRLEEFSELESDIYELQAELRDFFHHIRKTDALISDVITTSIIVWVSCFSVFSVISNYTLSTSRARADLIVLIYTLELIAFLIISAGSFSLLKLHKNCLKSYVTICALMAYDQTKHKRNYAKLMEFYTVKKSSAYTVLQQYPYTKTTYLSIFGWTLTCFFLIDSLLH